MWICKTFVEALTNDDYENFLSESREIEKR